MNFQKVQTKTIQTMVTNKCKTTQKQFLKRIKKRKRFQCIQFYKKNSNLCLNKYKLQKSKQIESEPSDSYQFVSSAINDELDDDKLIEEALKNREGASNSNQNRKLFQIEAKYLNSDNEVFYN